MFIQPLGMHEQDNQTLIAHKDILKKIIMKDSM
jgi:hypothetical protein